MIGIKSLSRCTFLFIVCVLSFNNITYAQKTPVNVIIYCDLSERLARSGQIETDKLLIKNTIENFRDIVIEKYIGGQLRSQDKISIHYNPPIAGREIASNLSVDFSRFDRKIKLKKFLNFFPKDSVSKIDLVVEQLYIEAKKQHPKYPGSDLYSFLRNDLPSLILPDYNNRLLILTDGYVYMSKSNPSRVGNKLGHLEGPFLDPLRNKTDWIERFKNGDWGLVHSGVNFTNLDVLCLQFVPDCSPRTNLRPLKPCLNEFDILKKMWVEWFAKMGVNDISILSKSQNITPSVNAINIFLTQD